MQAPSPVMWILLFGLVYLAVALYWARQAAIANQNYQSFFSAGHALSPVVSAMVLAGSSVSAWFTLGSVDVLARDGLVHVYLLQAGVLLALPGVLFYKRSWFIAQRYRISSQAELFRLYYDSRALVVIVAGVALLFAVGFAGMQLRAVAQLASTVSGGAVSAFTMAGALSIILVGYVVIGGMRAVGYLGVLQTVSLISATLVLSFLVLIEAGLIGAINAQMQAMRTEEAGAQFFEVSGVIQFVAGLGRAGFYDHPVSAVANLSSAYALLGIGLSPFALKVVLSTRNTKAIAAGQTWVLAGFFGLLVLLPIGVIGAAGLGRAEFTSLSYLTQLAQGSPWLAAWIVLGFAAGMQVMSGLALLVASETLVRHIYKPVFASGISRYTTVSLTRIVAAVLAVIVVLMAHLAPVSTSALGAFSLSASAQLLIPMLGLCWFGWMTRPAVLAGLGFGLFAAFVTDAFGIGILSYLGLEVPWGRYPWTIHSAAWGLFFNIVVCLLVSAVSQKSAQSEFRQHLRAFVSDALAAPGTAPLRSYAWAAGLAWGFLAVGPGLIFGNYAFISEGVWTMDFPSLWVWTMLFWLLGVTLVWLLAYRMQMASHLEIDITSYEPPPRLRVDASAAEARRLRNLIVFAVAAAGLIILIVWSFGGSG
ncbi:MAG: sodium:solute symporter family transporter [Roseovarius sp.]